MSTLTIIPSDGIYPRRDPYDLPGNSATAGNGVIVRSAAVTADNADLRNGRLKPRKALGASVGTGNTSIYLYGSTWLSWATDVDVVKSPIESSDRILYTGDGVPKIRENTTVYPLGIPAPAAAPTVTEQAKTSFGYTLTWHYYYEEPNGVREDADAVAISVTETVPGVTYTLQPTPTRVAASAESRFVMWAELYEGSKYLGKVIPDPAIDAPQSDAEYNGSTVTGDLVLDTILIIITRATFTLSYDTSRASQYTAERSYYYCYVRKWSDGKVDLGPPGTTSALIGIDPAENASLTGISTPPTGYGITHIWIYRLAVSISGEDYQYVDEIAAGVSTYLDEIADADLGDVDPEYIYSVPPTDLSCIKAHPAGFVLGISTTLKSVCCSAIREVHAFPSLSHRYALKDTPIAIELIGNTIVVTTDGDPVYLYGDDPAALSPPDRIPISQANKSKRSTIFTGDSVVYASPDGLVTVGQGSGQIVSNAHYTKEQWAALDPATMICAWHDRQIFVFHSTGCLIFRMDGGVELTTTTDTVDGVHVDLENDKLYLSDGGGIYEWAGGFSDRTATYRSGYIRYPSLQTFAAVRVDAANYPVTLNLYRNGDSTVTKVISSNVPVALPRGTSARQWEGFEVVSAYEVDQVVLAESRQELGV